MLIISNTGTMEKDQHNLDPFKKMWFNQDYVVINSALLYFIRVRIYDQANSFLMKC